MAQRIKREINVELGNVTFTIVKNGVVIVAGIDDIFGKDTLAGLVKLDKSGVLVRGVLHGINAKVGDSAAAKDADDEATINATIAQVKSGVWAARSSGGTSKSDLLYEAMVRHFADRTADEITEKLESMTDDDKKAMRLHAQIKPIIEEIKAERAVAKAKASKAKEIDDDTADLEF